MSTLIILADAPDHVRRHASVLPFDHDVTAQSTNGVVARPLESAR